jgi:hypothetical protein
MTISILSCRTIILASCFAGLLLTLTGCATQLSHKALVPLSLEVTKHHPQSVAVVASGGTETSVTGKPQVSDVELQQAVAVAISQSKTFSRVVDGKNGDYILTVNVFSINQPNFGLSLTVGVEMGWTLTRTDSGAKIWQEAIKSEHTVGVSEAFVGVTRLKLATEGAIRNNVKEGLVKIAALSL